MKPAGLPVALTIAGSDSGAHAGLQADLLTFAAHGVFGTTAVTCVTAQNPRGISAIEAMTPALVAEQVRQVLRYFRVRALKTGMLFSVGIIDAVADCIRMRPRIPAVIDPVMVATSGAVLLKPRAVAAVRERLLPLASLVTPNLDETAVLLGEKPATAAEMIEAGHALARAYGVPFLVKGGHLPGGRITDVLVHPKKGFTAWTFERVRGVDTHGSGCTLSAAIAANLAKGFDLTDAVAAARNYLHRGLRRALRLGGRRHIGH